MNFANNVDNGFKAKTIGTDIYARMAGRYGMVSSGFRQRNRNGIFRILS